MSKNNKTNKHKIFADAIRVSYDEREKQNCSINEVASHDSVMYNSRLSFEHESQHTCTVHVPGMFVAVHVPSTPY